MNKTEAREGLLRALDIYRKEPYPKLAEMIDRHDRQIFVGASGTSYQVDIRIRWDSKPGGEVRVIGSVDDATALHAMFPLTEDFLVSPSH